MKLTRREVIVGAAAGAALGAAGVYELVDQLTDTPTRSAPVGPRSREQHVLDGVRTIRDNGIEVLVPPLHHEVVTARVNVDVADLADASRALEEALARLDASFPATPAGLGVTVAWGLPYFRRFVPGQARTHVPVDQRASKSALIDAIRFPSDPDETILEENDVAVLLRSDSLEHLEEAERALFEKLDVLTPTSIRKGFAGGGFEGGQSLPKRMALAAGVPGADLIPETSELFLGFTSTQKAGLGPPRIANFETLGYVDLGPRGYFRGGTHMHVSHVSEDVEAWYLNFDFQERVDTSFRPGLVVEPGTQTVPQPADEVASTERVLRDFKLTGRIGHSAAIQTTSRLAADVLGADGAVYKAGTAIPQRADFNTLDNPFFWSVDPARDSFADGPLPGVHFVVFNPSSDDFHRNRLAMDGVFPGGRKLPLPPRGRGQGFNAVLRTTHRQNFLVPPRAHRSFPLAELKA
jgi:hypothetical protein